MLSFVDYKMWCRGSRYCVPLFTDGETVEERSIYTSTQIN